MACSNDDLNPTGTDLDMDFYAVCLCPIYLALGLFCLKNMGWSKVFPCAMGLKLFVYMKNEIGAWQFL